MKICNKCNEQKPLDQFYKATKWNLQYGVDYYCKSCRNKAHRESVNNNKKRCTIDGCARPHYAKGICQAHYEKAKRDRNKENKNG